MKTTTEMQLVPIAKLVPYVNNARTHSRSRSRLSLIHIYAYLAYLSALAYQAFVMKRRDMKYVVSALQAAKPMLEISVSDLDRDGFLLNLSLIHISWATMEQFFKVCMA